MRNTLQRQLRELAERTNARAAADPLNAYEIREESLLRAHELVEEQQSAPALRLVDRRPMPPPGNRAWRIAMGMDKRRRR